MITKIGIVFVDRKMLLNDACPGGNRQSCGSYAQRVVGITDSAIGKRGLESWNGTNIRLIIRHRIARDTVEERQAGVTIFPSAAYIISNFF